MHIVLKEVLTKIDSLISGLPYEVGGIIGSHSGICIDEVVVDTKRSKNTRLCSYSPDVDFLNSQIELWQDKEIQFMGIFHTHLGGSKSLSHGDKKYINEIMKNMPKEIFSLYFPIYVLPQKEWICYKAERTADDIEIYRCITEIK